MDFAFKTRRGRLYFAEDIVRTDYYLNVGLGNQMSERWSVGVRLATKWKDVYVSKSVLNFPCWVCRESFCLTKQEH